MLTGSTQPKEQAFNISSVLSIFSKKMISSFLLIIECYLDLLVLNQIYAIPFRNFGLKYYRSHVLSGRAYNIQGWGKLLCFQYPYSN